MNNLNFIAPSSSTSYQGDISEWVVHHVFSQNQTLVKDKKISGLVEIIFKTFGLCYCRLAIPLAFGALKISRFDLESVLNRKVNEYEAISAHIWRGEYKKPFEIGHESLYSGNSYAPIFYFDRFREHILRHPFPLQYINLLSLNESLREFKERFENSEDQLKNEIYCIKLIINFLDSAKTKLGKGDKETFSPQNLNPLKTLVRDFVRSKAAICVQAGPEGEVIYQNWIQFIQDWSEQGTEIHKSKVLALFKFLDLDVPKASSNQGSNSETSFFQFLISRSYQCLLSSLHVTSLPKWLEKNLKASFEESEYKRKMILLGSLSKYHHTAAWAKIVKSESELIQLSRFIELRKFLSYDHELALQIYDRPFSDDEWVTLQNTLKRVPLLSKNCKKLSSEELLADINQSLHIARQEEWVGFALMPEIKTIEDFLKFDGYVNECKRRGRPLFTEEEWMYTSRAFLLLELHKADFLHEKMYSLITGIHHKICEPVDLDVKHVREMFPHGTTVIGILEYMNKMLAEKHLTSVLWPFEEAQWSEFVKGFFDISLEHPTLQNDEVTLERNDLRAKKAYLAAVHELALGIPTIRCLAEYDILHQLIMEVKEIKEIFMAHFGEERWFQLGHCLRNDTLLILGNYVKITSGLIKVIGETKLSYSTLLELVILHDICPKDVQTITQFFRSYQFNRNHGVTEKEKVEALTSLIKATRQTNFINLTEKCELIERSSFNEIKGKIHPVPLFFWVEFLMKNEGDEFDRVDFCSQIELLTEILKINLPIIPELSLAPSSQNRRGSSNREDESRFYFFHLLNQCLKGEIAYRHIRLLTYLYSFMIDKDVHLKIDGKVLEKFDRSRIMIVSPHSSSPRSVAARKKDESDEKLTLQIPKSNISQNSPSGALQIPTSIYGEDPLDLTSSAGSTPSQSIASSECSTPFLERGIDLNTLQRFSSDPVHHMKIMQATRNRRGSVGSTTLQVPSVMRIPENHPSNSSISSKNFKGFNRPFIPEPSPIKRESLHGLFEPSVSIYPISSSDESRATRESSNSPTLREESQLEDHSSIMSQVARIRGHRRSQTYSPGASPLSLTRQLLPKQDPEPFSPLLISNTIEISSSLSHSTSITQREPSSNSISLTNHSHPSPSSLSSPLSSSLESPSNIPKIIEALYTKPSSEATLKLDLLMKMMDSEGGAYEKKLFSEYLEIVSRIGSDFHFSKTQMTTLFFEYLPSQDPKSGVERKQSLNQRKSAYRLFKMGIELLSKQEESLKKLENLLTYSLRPGFAFVWLMYSPDVKKAVELVDGLSKDCVLLNMSHGFGVANEDQKKILNDLSVEAIRLRMNYRLSLIEKLDPSEKPSETYPVHQQYLAHFKIFREEFVSLKAPHAWKHLAQCFERSSRMSIEKTGGGATTRDLRLFYPTHRDGIAFYNDLRLPTSDLAVPVMTFSYLNLRTHEAVTASYALPWSLKFIKDNPNVFGDLQDAILHSNQKIDKVHLKKLYHFSSRNEKNQQLLEKIYFDATENSSLTSSSSPSRKYSQQITSFVDVLKNQTMSMLICLTKGRDGSASPLPHQLPFKVYSFSSEKICQVLPRGATKVIRSMVDYIRKRSTPSRARFYFGKQEEDAEMEYKEDEKKEREVSLGNVVSQENVEFIYLRYNPDNMREVCLTMGERSRVIYYHELIERENFEQLLRYHVMMICS